MSDMRREPQAGISDKPAIDPRIEAQELFTAIKANLAALEELRGETQGEWGTADAVYRFYHQSFKVYRAQDMTVRVVRALQSLLPERPLNSWFRQIVAEGTNKQFSTAHNKYWLEATRPILEAYFHALFFLEMAIRSGRTLEAPPTFLPNSWASVLYLFDLR